MSADADSTRSTRQPTVVEWREIVARFEQPSTWRAAWQIVDTLVPLALLWYLMYLALEVSWWLTIPLAALAGALLIRVFIIFHDCGHGSFFKSRFANDVTGFVAGMLTFTPYYHWRWEHALHHQTSGDLDRRGTGDIWTMTVQEYLESSRWRRFAYHLARNPVVLFVLAPVFLFALRQRLPSPSAGRRERDSVWWMNIALFGMAVALSSAFGIVPYLLIQTVVMFVAGAAGVWLFYVQHQFEDAYWERREDWDYTAAALQGSSFYKLPRVLNWLSGNIGYHHIHHLSARIPNYNLKRCHESHELFREVKAITLFPSLKTMGHRLWDDRKRKLVGFAHLRRLRRAAKHGNGTKVDDGDAAAAAANREQVAAHGPAQDDGPRSRS